MTKIKNTCSNWGGSWTEKKLDAFMKYVQAYLKIMKYQKNKNNWKIIYFDGFAGSGEGAQSLLKWDEEASLFKEQTVECCEECKVYQGAAERIVSLQENGFDYIYFVEKDDESINKLREKLKQHGNKNVIYRKGDANEELRKMAQGYKKNGDLASLVFLDPFGMEIKWESIQGLKNTRTDIWILIPTGVIINRLLDKKGVLKSNKKLDVFLGLSTEEIKKYFYKTKKDNTIFGEETISEKIPNAIPKIAELYIKRLKTVWRHVTDKPLVLYNSNNVPIFHFVFASNNKTAEKIASQIIE